MATYSVLLITLTTTFPLIEFVGSAVGDPPGSFGFGSLAALPDMLSSANAQSAPKRVNNVYDDQGRMIINNEYGKFYGEGNGQVIHGNVDFSKTNFYGSSQRAKQPSSLSSGGYGFSGSMNTNSNMGFQKQNGGTYRMGNNAVDATVGPFEKQKNSFGFGSLAESLPDIFSSTNAHSAPKRGNNIDDDQGRMIINNEGRMNTNSNMGFQKESTGSETYRKSSNAVDATVGPFENPKKRVQVKIQSTISTIIWLLSKAKARLRG